VKNTDEPLWRGRNTQKAFLFPGLPPVPNVAVLTDVFDQQRQIRPLIVSLPDSGRMSRGDKKVMLSGAAVL